MAASTSSATISAKSTAARTRRSTSECAARNALSRGISQTRAKVGMLASVTRSARLRAEISRVAALIASKARVSGAR